MSGPTNPIEVYFDKGQWGWDGTLWRKLNLTWGYNDRLFDQTVNADCAAGDVTLNHTAVPTGGVWVVTGASVYASYAEGTHYLRANFGGTTAIVYNYGTLGAGVYSATPPLNIVLKAGDFLYDIWIAAPLHAVVVSNIWGYEMKVA